MNILVVGDIMLDCYMYGDVNRISPEAPVPVVDIKRKVDSLGGSGNVARNLAELGVHVTCVGVVGDDKAGKDIEKMLIEDNGITSLLYRSPDRKTTTKTRFCDSLSGRQMLRIDEETKKPFKDYYNVTGDYDVIIVSDYGKGFVTKELMAHLISSGTSVIVDPYPPHRAFYGGAYLITPNIAELKAMGRLPVPINYCLVTKGAKGMTLFGLHNVDEDIPVEPVKVYDVQGAGDTVTAVVAYCTAAGLDIVKSAEIANQCARYVVSQPGTSCVPKSVFKEICNDRS